MLNICWNNYYNIELKDVTIPGNVNFAYVKTYSIYLFILFLIKIKLQTLPSELKLIYVKFP